MSDRENQKSSAAGRRRLVRRLAILLAVLLTLTMLEAGSRMLGVRPIYNAELDRLTASFRVEPDGTICDPDEQLGFVNRPGRFRMSFDDRTWTVTHGSDGERIPPSPDLPDAESGDVAPATSHAPAPRIWVFGCSFTHGFGVDDEQTFCAHLAQMLPDWDVVNFGVDGYSDVQSLLLFRRMLRRRAPPALVLHAYAGFHDVRNTQARVWRQQLLLTNRAYRVDRVPYAFVQEGGALAFASRPLTYDRLPGERYSAFLTLIQIIRNQSDSASRSAGRTTRRVLEEFADECKRNAIAFHLICVGGNGADTLSSLDPEAVPFSDVTLSNEPGDFSRVDGHPTAAGHQKLATRIYLALCGWQAHQAVTARMKIAPRPDRVVRLEPLAAREPWELQIKSAPFCVRKGDMLRLQTQIRADSDRAVWLRCGQEHSPWQAVAPQQSLRVGTQWQEIDVAFPCDRDDESVVVAIQFGGDATPIEVKPPHIRRNGQSVAVCPLPRAP